MAAWKPPAYFGGIVFCLYLGGAEGIALSICLAFMAGVEAASN